MISGLRVVSAVLAVLAACNAAAQSLYRWTDENGRTHVTDTPPPPSAKNVRKKEVAPGGGAELSAAVKEFPVVLYSAPACQQPCGDARALLNRRGVPFKEVVVWTTTTGDELVRMSGSRVIPTLIVGTSVYKGFQPDTYNAALDYARYPKVGAVPARAQTAPSPPKEYLEAKEEAENAEAAEAARPRGPYAPGAQRQAGTPASK